MWRSIWSTDSVGQIGLFNVLFKRRKSATKRAAPGVFFGTAKALCAHGVGFSDGSKIPASIHALSSRWKPALKCQGTSNGRKFCTGLILVFSSWYRCTGGMSSQSALVRTSLKVEANFSITLAFSFKHSSSCLCNFADLTD